MDHPEVTDHLETAHDALHRHHGAETLAGGPFGCPIFENALRASTPNCAAAVDALNDAVTTRHTTDQFNNCRHRRFRCFDNLEDSTSLIGMHTADCDQQVTVLEALLGKCGGADFSISCRASSRLDLASYTFLGGNCAARDGLTTMLRRYGGVTETDVVSAIDCQHAGPWFQVGTL